MGKKRTKVIGGEEFEGLMPEDLLKRSAKEEKKDQKDARGDRRQQRKKQARAIQGIEATLDKLKAQEQDAKISESPEATQEEVKKVVAKRKKIEHKKTHGKLYKEALSKLDRKKIYKVDEAIEFLKKISYTKFDQTVELHVRTVSKKGQEAIRFTMVLPAGAPKQPKIRIIDEVALQEIEAGKIDFEIAIATPAIMSKLAKFAKILGPRGLMPNPKAGTVTDDPPKAVEQFQKGQIEVRADSLGNIHVGLAKLSWDTPKIVENVKSVLAHIPTLRIGSITLTSTMAPGLKISA